MASAWAAMDTGFLTMNIMTIMVLPDMGGHSELDRIVILSSIFTNEREYASVKMMASLRTRS